MIINRIRSVIGAFGEVFAGLLPRRYDGANFGDINTIRAMKKKCLVSRKGSFLHLGFFKEEKISLMKTLSVLVIGDSGTGKTAGFMVPSIVDSTKCCMLINDPKMELWDITSGYRSSLGPTFKLDWTSMNNATNRQGSSKFNFLNSRIASSSLVWRCALIELIVEALIPEESKCTLDHYAFVEGKRALRGFLHMIVAKINDRNDVTKYDDIDEPFKEKEASLPMLANWFANKMEANRRAHAGDNSARRMIDTIEDVIKEAEEHDYPFLVKSELISLTNCTDEVRIGILAAVEKSLGIFADPAVAQSCSSSDFTPEDLRGCLTEQALCRVGRDRYPETRDEWDIVQKMVQPEDWKPVSVYLCTDLAANPHVANLTKLFFQICSGAMLGWKPNETPTSSVKLGPFPVCFALDEFDKLPKTNEIFDAPAISRSQQVFYLFSVQNYSQIENVYPEYGASSIDGTTGVKVIFRQSNEDSINRIVQAVGSTREGENLLSNENLSCMPVEKHLILVQGFTNSPISVKTPMYFQFPEFREKTFNPRTQMGPPVAPARPDGNRA